MDRVDAKTAGYMELRGAKKDGDCRQVYVPRGISRLLGCCNLFHPEAVTTRNFRCGDCEYVKERGARQF